MENARTVRMFFNACRRHLTLAFAAATIAASGMRGPFELHDLRLVDQGRMFVLHRQARALVDRSDH